jgi:uncharacterized protein YkwD
MAHGGRPGWGISWIVLLAIALVAAQPAAASQPASRAACDGVRLVSAPFLAAGIGGLTLEISEPLDGLILCQPISLRSHAARPATPKAGCENSRVPGFKLRPKLAAESVRCLIDKERAARGLHQLDPQEKLKKAAKRHTEHMLASGCFAHSCPGEANLVGRVTSAGYLPCACTWSVGENIAWGTRRKSTPAGIVDAWMHSPPHRETILTASMREVDVGVRSGKPGNHNAKGATYTANFGFKT